MEVDGLGARCALASCRHLDYLPFRCPHCTSSFCREHQTPSSHFCRSAPSSRPDVPACPLCGAPVPIPAGSTPDLAVARHVDAGCPKRVRSNPECAAADCSVRDVAATRCVACNKVFCIAHRLEADHDCTAVRQVRTGVDPFGNRLRGSAARGSKARKTPPLLRRGKSAVGKGESQIRLDFSNTPSTPMGDTKVEAADRVTVALYFPAGSKLQPRYAFFSGRLSAGRIIDGLRKNVAGLPTTQDGERYCLYAVKRGVSGVNLLPHITPLKDLPRDVLQSGDMIVLERGEGGLDQAWVAALQKTGSSARFSSSRRSGAAGKMDKCVVA